MTAEIAGLFDGTDRRAGLGQATAETLANRYMAGHLVRVTDKLGVEADMERLVDLDEAWALCIRRPWPGFRLFGRFIERDAFVATEAWHRSDLGRTANYTAMAQAMIDNWDAAVPGVHPVSFKNVTEYMSGAVDYVDES